MSFGLLPGAKTTEDVAKSAPNTRSIRPPSSQRVFPDSVLHLDSIGNVVGIGKRQRNCTRSSDRGEELLQENTCVKFGQPARRRVELR
jgi:hypothetical protein